MPTTSAEVLELLAASPIHSRWSPSDIERLIAAPGRTGNLLLFRDRGRLVGLLTFALLTEEAERGFLRRSRKLQPGDWRAGDRLWFIDFIAPYGHASQILNGLRRSGAFNHFGRARWARTHGTGRIQHIGEAHAPQASRGA